ncbi:MAG: hypothetical protein ACYTFU_10585, partial [Planctomycetota bacterium]
MQSVAGTLSCIIRSTIPSIIEVSISRWELMWTIFVVSWPQALHRCMKRGLLVPAKIVKVGIRNAAA